MPTEAFFYPESLRPRTQGRIYGADTPLITGGRSWRRLSDLYFTLEKGCKARAALSGYKKIAVLAEEISSCLRETAKNQDKLESV